MGIVIRQAQTNFTRGELAPEMKGRYDMAAFRNGAQQLENFAPLIQGGARTRPGLVYKATLGYNPSVLADFIFNDAQRYVIAFSNTRADIYELQTWTLAASLTSCPWTTAMLDELSWTQFGDTMILCHPDIPMQVITRTGATSFTRADFAFEENSGGTVMYQPYYKFAATDMTLAASGTTGSVTLTLSGAGAFTSDHIGFIVRKDEVEIEITAVASATSATGTCRATITTAATTDWDEAVFSDARGYANDAEFYNDRLWLLGSAGRPTGRWFSKVGAYYNFDVGSAEDNEASWDAVNGRRLSKLRYGVGGRHMIMFADRSVFYQPETASRPVTPNNAASQEQEQVGVGDVKPMLYDQGVLMVQKEGAVVGELRYNDVDQQYKFNPLSHLAPHLISSPTDLTVLYDSPARTEKYAILVNGDGNLSVLHSSNTEEVLAWVPWSTTGTFKSAVAVGSDVVVAVERELNSSTVLTLEVFDDDADKLDCSKEATSGTPTKSFSGFAHLANETVSVTTNGHSLGTYDIDGSGNLTLGDLDPEVEVVEAGLAFTQTIQPMPAVFDLRDGESRGSVIGLVRALLEVDRSDAFAVNSQDILLEFAGDDYDSAPPTKTGILEISSLGYDQDAAPTITIATPAKITVLSMVREVEVNE